MGILSTCVRACKFIHSESSCGGSVFSGVCFSVRLSVCLSFHTISKKTAVARITKVYTEMLYHESWKTIYFGVRRSKIKVTMHKKVPAWIFCTLVSADFFWLIDCAPVAICGDANNSCIS